jgi:hypothetical protein
MLAWTKAHKHLLCVSMLVVIFTLLNVVNTNRNYYAPDELISVWLLQTELFLFAPIIGMWLDDELLDDQEQEDRP